MGGAGNDALCGAAHLVKFGHQVALGVQASGGIDDDVIGAAGVGSP